MLGEGPGGVARLLRLPGGALAEPADDEPHRVDLRHDTVANGEDQELPEREDGAESRASARHERREKVAPATRLPSSGRRDLRREIHQWGGRKRNGREGRRWIHDGHTPELTVTRPRNNIPSMHEELFVGLYTNLIAFLEERRCKRVSIELRTDRIDSPIVKNFEKGCKRVLKPYPQAHIVPGWDTVKNKKS